MAVRRVRDRLRHEPLWQRVERNRVRLALFTAAFLAVSAAAAVAVIVPTAWLVFLAVFVETGGAVPETLWHPGSLAVAAGSLGVLTGGWHLYRTLSTPLRARLGAMGAKWVRLDEMPETRGALKDMAIASGVTDPPPDLFVLESTGVNAFLIAKGGQQPIAVVTTALADRFDADEQRAVFANLLARYRAGDVHWATAVSAVMSPLWRWRDRDLSGESDLLLKGRIQTAHVAGDTQAARFVSTPVVLRAEKPAGHVTILSVFASAPLGLVAYCIAVVVSELVMAGHRSSQLLAAEKADSEGMLLLKDPRVALRTLRKAVEADNRVRLAVPMYAGLFYVWAGDDLADDEDPEWQRVARLREVLGVDGAMDAAREAEQLVAASLAVAEVMPPPAPRLEAEAAAAGAAREAAADPFATPPAWIRAGALFRIAAIACAAAFAGLPLWALARAAGLAWTPGAVLAGVAPFAAAGVGALLGEPWLGGLAGLVLLLAARALLAAEVPADETWHVVYLWICFIATLSGGVLGSACGAAVKGAFSDLERTRK